MFHPFFGAKNGWSPSSLLKDNGVFVLFLNYREAILHVSPQLNGKRRQLPTCCSVHTESNTSYSFAFNGVTPSAYA